MSLIINYFFQLYYVHVPLIITIISEIFTTFSCAYFHNFFMCKFFPLFRCENFLNFTCANFHIFFKDLSSSHFTNPWILKVQIWTIFSRVCIVLNKSFSSFFLYKFLISMRHESNTSQNFWLYHMAIFHNSIVVHILYYGKYYNVISTVISFAGYR